MAKKKITKDMMFADVLQKYPVAGEVIARYGLHCLGCSGAAFESIEVGSKVHGLSDTEIDAMVDEINAVLDKKETELETEKETGVVKKEKKKKKE